MIEYPEAGERTGEVVAHRFAVDILVDDYIEPQLNIQYYLGEGHGGHSNIRCYLLQDLSDVPLYCRKLTYCCMLYSITLF